jgi:hypothetical protein
MSKHRNQHVVPRDGQWAVVGAGSSRATVVTEKQSTAIAIANKIATDQQTELLIHNRQGRIRERRSHGHDPNNRKG